MKHNTIRLFLATVILSATSAPPSISWAAPSSKNNLSPKQAIQALLTGNQRYISGRAHACSNASAMRARLENSQAPNAIILSCSDSRVPPEQIFDQPLGQLFVVRVAGNVLNTDAIASMEYAVKNLGSRLIVILGHESCGAVESALKFPAGKTAGSPALDHLLSQIRQNLGSMTSSKDPKVRAPVMKNANSVASHLLKRSKLIHDAVAQGQVQIVEGIYDLGTGKVDLWNSSGPIS